MRSQVTKEALCNHILVLEDAFIDQIIEVAVHEVRSCHKHLQTTKIC